MRAMGFECQVKENLVCILAGIVRLCTLQKKEASLNGEVLMCTYSLIDITFNLVNVLSRAGEYRKCNFQSLGIGF